MGDPQPNLHEVFKEKDTARLMIQFEEKARDNDTIPNPHRVASNILYLIQLRMNLATEHPLDDIEQQDIERIYNHIKGENPETITGWGESLGEFATRINRAVNDNQGLQKYNFMPIDHVTSGAFSQEERRQIAYRLRYIQRAAMCGGLELSHILFTDVDSSDKRFKDCSQTILESLMPTVNTDNLTRLQLVDLMRSLLSIPEVMTATNIADPQDLKVSVIQSYLELQSPL